MGSDDNNNYSTSRCARLRTKDRPTHDTCFNACFGVRDLADQRWSTHIYLNSPTGLLSPKYQQAPRQRCLQTMDERVLFSFRLV